MRYDDYRYERADTYRSRNGLRTFGRWLSTRPLESWGFFIAGVIVAGVIF